MERLESLGKQVICFAKLVPKNTITLPLISQFIRAGTSIGANYCEANNSESKNDFIHKVGIARKEARETLYWIIMLIEAEPKLRVKSANLYQETKEVSLILSSIVNKLKS
ncbi:four helix bundle protein [Candidatus Shapirobacteria bacterium]|nr:four helix bundle protein [Candidatus Shapirobacteria bacterium]